MCIFTRFRYLCLHEKFKIAKACNKATLDRNSVLTCPNDPGPQPDDGKPHDCSSRTYGIGVCDSIHCAWHFSLLPLGDYGDDKLSGKNTSFENDTEIIDTPEAREDRVARWYRLLNADQQLDHYKTEYPLPYDQRSTAGRALLEFPYGAAVGPWDTLQWQELNPLHLNPAMLQWLVLSRVLPASVVDGRKSNTISPLQPDKGPFKKLTNAHKCRKKHGICKKCGANIGDRALKEATLAYRQKAALIALKVEDGGKADLKGTVWDPSVDLKWDDATGRYTKVQTNHELQDSDATYQASSDSSFASPKTQQVEIPAVFHDQDKTLLFDNSGDTNTEELGFPDGMGWQDFTESATSAIIVTPLATTTGSLYWPDLDFPPGIGELLFSSSQSGKQQQHDPFFSDPSSSDSFPLSSSLPSEQTTFIQQSSSTAPASLEKQIGNFIAEQQIANDSDYSPSPATLRVLAQMMRQATAAGGTVRPSYDAEANELFEMMMQHSLAGLLSER